MHKPPPPRPSPDHVLLRLSGMGEVNWIWEKREDVIFRINRASEIGFACREATAQEIASLIL